MRTIGTQIHNTAVSDAIDLYSNSRTDIATSTVAAQSAALTEGLFDVWSDVDCYIKVNPTASDVTAANGYLLRANNTVVVFVRPGHKIGAILAVGTGTLSYHRVG